MAKQIKEIIFGSKMDRAMKITMMEKHAPNLLKDLDIGKINVKEVKPMIFRKGKIIISSEVLYKLEELAMKYLKKGHRVIKPIFISWKGEYEIIFTYEKDENSPYLQLKKSIDKNE